MAALRSLTESVLFVVFSAERRERTTPARLCLSYLTKRLLCSQRWKKLSQEVKLKVDQLSNHVFQHFGVCFLDHSGSILKPYEFKMEEIEGFRYRCRVSIVSIRTYLASVIQEEYRVKRARVCIGFL